MRRLIHSLTLAVAIGGLAVASVAAGAIVDPSTLTPEPPPGSTCVADGAWVRCDGSSVDVLVNSPSLELPCGLTYETATDSRRRVAWYRDGLLDHRSVHATYRGSVSLSSTGSGPSAGASGNWSWSVVYTTPGDDSTGILMSHGNQLRVDGMGRSFRITGVFKDNDAIHHGLFTFDDESMQALCELLGG
jgi:hypothetical protein